MTPAQGAAVSGEVRGLAVFWGQMPYGQKHVGLGCFNKLLLTLPSRDVRYRISIAGPRPDASSRCTRSREAGSSPPECFQTACLWPFMRPHVLFFLPSVSSLFYVTGHRLINHQRGLPRVLSWLRKHACSWRKDWGGQRGSDWHRPLPASAHQINMQYIPQKKNRIIF